MGSDITCVLIHSPLVGPLTWELVAEQLRRRGMDVIVPRLADPPESERPLWSQHAESVRQTVASLPETRRLVLVAHSDAGPILAAIRQALPHRVAAYVFVDAGIPRDGFSHLDLLRVESAEWADSFHQGLLQGALFPTWSEEDLRVVIPDDDLREKMVAEIQPRGLTYFTQPIPVFEGWPDAPCVYIRFSETYRSYADQARKAGWPVHEIEAGHFHMLVEPAAVAGIILESVEELL